ncbi:hypothetical protein Hanom_Chr04g00285501 [Helianthus anomalus]
MEHSQFREKSQPMNERFWQENGVNLRHIITGSANNNQTVNGVILKKEENLSSFLSFLEHSCYITEIQDKAATEIEETTKMKNNVTNVVEFANGASEESLEKMQNLHADFYGSSSGMLSHIFSNFS